MLIQRSILVAATKAVAKLVVSCIVGYVFTKRGMITQNALTVMSKLVYKIFLPCLLFVNVTRTIASTNQGVGKLFVLPASAVLLVIFGIIIGKVMERIICLQPGSPDSRELRVCTAFSNCGALPVIFMEAIFGSAGDQEALPITVAYISFFILGWSPVFWTIGYTMVTGHSQRAPELQALEPDDPEPPSPSSPLIKKDTTAFHRKVVDRFWRMMKHPSTEKILSPPFLGCLAGIVVGACPWTDSLLASRDAPLFPILDALQCVGNGYVPAAVLVLAGSLANTQSGSEPTIAGGAWSSSVFWRKVAAIMVSRFLAMPLISVAMLLAGFRAGIIPYEKLLWFVLLLEGCMPPAQNSVIVLQMEESPALAASMARTLTAVYLLSAVPMAILISATLEFVDKAEGMQ